MIETATYIIDKSIINSLEDTNNDDVKQVLEFIKENLKMSGIFH